MKWISIKDREPEIKDLPFVTRMILPSGGREYELWEDSDWFDELDEADRLGHDFWFPLQGRD